MKEFFHGWRRKMGCVALAMACVLMGLWARGQFYDESIAIRPSERLEIRVRCTATQIRFEYLQETTPFGAYRGFSLVDWKSIPSDNDPYRYEPIAESGFWESRLKNRQTAHGKYRQFFIGYLTFVLPLSLLSACLNLWKPRNRGLCPN